MSWLKLNDSLNNIKGQLTNFATNVLSDDLTVVPDSGEFEELQRACASQQEEIQQLRELNQKLSNTQKGTTNHHDDSHQSEDTSWSWDAAETATSEDVSNLKKRIRQLKTEKNDLVRNLELLDSEYQQNTEKIVGIKDRLQNDYKELEDRYDTLKESYQNLEANRCKDVKELEELKTKHQEVVERAGEEKICDKCNRLQQHNQVLLAEVESLKSELEIVSDNNNTSNKVLEDVGRANKEELESLKEKLKLCQSENRILVREVKKSSEILAGFERKSLVDEENYKGLSTILQEYEERVRSLQEELRVASSQIAGDKLGAIVEQLREEKKLVEDLQVQLEKEREDKKLFENEGQKLSGVVEDLRVQLSKKREDEESGDKEAQKLTELVEELQIQLEKLCKEKELVENQVRNLNGVVEDLHVQLKKAREDDQFDKSNVYGEEISRLRNTVKDLESQLKTVAEEKARIRRKYIDFLSEYVGCDKPSDLELNGTKDEAHVSFSSQVDNLMKIVLDLRSKCDNLETEVYNITQEKTERLTEKNHEIEKLLQNSEILSQEVITKSQTIKDYENECNELMKNNDILITELEGYKNTSGLQTISESNEDNLLLLESQLESANKKIEELERAKGEDVSSIQEAMEGLSLKDFDEVKTENDSLREEIKKLEEDQEVVLEENDKLNAALERMRVDLENNEYQYAEINISVEMLRDEVENQKNKVEELIAQNSNLEKLNLEYERNNEEVRTELNAIREKLVFEEDTRRGLDSQVRSLTEKLQNAKMIETSLKLQYDTVNKELIVVADAKNALEVKLKDAYADLERHRKESDELRSMCAMLERKLTESCQGLVERDEAIRRLKLVEEQLENLAVDESGQLLTNLHITTDLDKKVERELTEVDQKLEHLAIGAGEDVDALKFQNAALAANFNELRLQINAANEEKDSLQAEIARLVVANSQHQQCSQTIAMLERNVAELNASKTELTNVVIAKHHENVTYHNEIQRLSQILKAEVEKAHRLELQLQESKDSATDAKKEELEKLTDQNNFLRQKCEVLAENLLQEQAKVQQVLAERSGVSEKEQALTKKLERLQSHLIELEEHYTEELLKAEEKNAELQTKVNEIEQREKNSSTMYTSVSIRANQHVETLQHQLQMVTNQRDELRKKMSDAEDHSNRQAAALANLQFVLEQFQKDKEKDVQQETERIRRQIAAEKRVQNELKAEIVSLQSQLEESKQGLQAASRLSDQLEQSKQLVSTLRGEVSQLKEKLSKNEQQLRNLSSQTDGKVDKSLIKNLIIGFISTNNNLTKDQTQILKIIATVLDFNQQDHDKLNMNRPQQGWLGSFLAPQTSQGMSQESLSQAFVKFLENESKPRVVPSLLGSTSENGANSRKTSSSGSAPRQSPIVLSEVMLPTFADFAQNRNSSSILKDVLKDNS